MALTLVGCEKVKENSSVDTKEEVAAISVSSTDNRAGSVKDTTTQTKSLSKKEELECPTAFTTNLVEQVCGLTGVTITNKTSRSGRVTCNATLNANSAAPLVALAITVFRINADLDPVSLEPYKSLSGFVAEKITQIENVGDEAFAVTFVPANLEISGTPEEISAYYGNHAAFVRKGAVVYQLGSGGAQGSGNGCVEGTAEKIAREIF